MSTLNERISEVVSASGNTKTKFAEAINISQPFLSQICSGAKTPSDRTIADICRKFNVNELWLREGVGEMFRPMSRNEKLASFFGDVLADKPEAFRVRLCAALAELDEAEWEVAEKFFKNLAGQ